MKSFCLLRSLYRFSRRNSSTLPYYNNRWNLKNGNMHLQCISNQTLNHQRQCLGSIFGHRYASTSESNIPVSKIQPIQLKKRVSKKKGGTSLEFQNKENSVVAYSTAEEYNIVALASEIKKQGLYKALTLPDDVHDVLHVTANYVVGNEPRHIFFFSEGSVVLWNIPELEQNSVVKFLKPFEINSYDESLVIEEKEDLDYFYSETETKLSKGHIFLKKGENNDLECLAFSNALALSVKLGVWEASLQSFIDNMHNLMEDMKEGKKMKITQNELTKKRWELFALRDDVNLSSDLLDTPDFFWDRDNLETIYQQTYNYLNISKRTKVINDRLSYCSEPIDQLSTSMTDQHHITLERMIIALIIIEVLFDGAYFLERILVTPS